MTIGLCNAALALMNTIRLSVNSVSTIYSQNKHASGLQRNCNTWLHLA